MRRARFSTPILAVNEVLLICWLVQLSFPGLFSHPGYRLLSEYGSQRVWSVYVAAVAAGMAVGMIWSPKLLIWLIPLCATFWGAIALTFLHASVHAIGWELALGFNALLIREYITAGWLGRRFDAASDRR